MPPFQCFGHQRAYNCPTKTQKYHLLNDNIFLTIKGHGVKTFWVCLTWGMIWVVISSRSILMLQSHSEIYWYHIFLVWFQVSSESCGSWHIEQNFFHPSQNQWPSLITDTQLGSILTWFDITWYCIPLSNYWGSPEPAVTYVIEITEGSQVLRWILIYHLAPEIKNSNSILGND